MKSLIVFLLFIAPLCTAAESRSIELADGSRLEGTLLLPEAPRAMIVLVSGSGPTDRDGNQAPMMVNNSLKMLAEALHEAGLASYRYDKRGVGQSSPGVEESDLRVQTYADDLVTVIEQVRSWADDTPLLLLGHSEGAMMALLAAQQTGVDGVISLAGPGRPADEILREQLAGRLPGALADEFEASLSSLRRGELVEQVSAPLASLFRPSVQPYMISWIAVDPAALAGTLGDKLTVIQGSSDLQVGAEDADRLADAAGIEPVIIDGMNHVLKAVTGSLEEQMPSYLDPELALHPDLLPAILQALE